MPALWASGRLSVQHKKEMLRSLIRRVILDREQAERVDVTIVWVSGAMTQMQVPTTTARTVQLDRYEELVARIAELSAAGFSDPVIAERLRQEGFRSSRQTSLPTSLVTRIRRSQCQVSVRGQFRSQAQVGGAWTVWGLARHLGVRRDWLYRRIVAGRLPAERHPVTGHYLIADDPQVLAALQVEVEDQLSTCITRGSCRTRRATTCRGVSTGARLRCQSQCMRISKDVLSRKERQFLLFCKG